MKYLLYSLVSALGFSFCAQNKSAQTSNENNLLETNMPQTNPAIKNAYAYWQVRIAGTIAVDENGNQLTKSVDTTYTVYLETSGDVTPEIQAVWINDKPHAVSLSPIAEKSVQIGLPTAAGKSVSINATAGNKLWQIDIGGAVTVNNKTLPVTTGNERAINQVIIEGVLNNKKFAQSIALIQLPRMEGL
jgi:hypothetical protein